MHHVITITSLMTILLASLLGQSSLALALTTQAASVLPASHPLIHYAGRFLFSDGTDASEVDLPATLASNDYAAFDWPCTTIHATFVGSGAITIYLAGGANRFQLTIAGKRHEFTGQKAGVEALRFVIPEHGRHEISLVKLTEASYFGSSLAMNQTPARFYGLTLEGSLAPTETRRPEQRFEIFGDSHANGFGIEKPAANPFTMMLNLKNYETCAKAYGSRLAKSLDAEVRIEAWSGKGVVKNSLDLARKSAAPMPVYWERTLASDTHTRVDFSAWTPQVVIIHLGGNDFFNWPYPSSAQFKDAYHDLLAKVVNSYAAAPPKILALCGISRHNAKTSCPLIKAAVAEFSKTYHAIDFVELSPSLFEASDWGTMDHLSEQGHAKIAAFLEPTLARLLLEG